MIRRHRWSVLSLVVTVGTWLALGGYTQYQYRYHHITNFSHLSPIGGCAVVVSVVTAAIGAFKERASIISIGALILGVFSTLFHVV